jgi:hypothetical protein
VLAAKPQVALENLSLKTTHGESKFNLVLDLAKPASMELPPVELGKQMIALLDANLTLSKPMIADVAACKRSWWRDRSSSHRAAIPDGQRDGQRHGRWHAAGDPGRQRRGVGAALRQQ